MCNIICYLISVFSLVTLSGTTTITYNVEIQEQKYISWYSNNTDSFDFLSLSCHLSQSAISLDRFSRWHPMSVESWLMQLFVGWLTFVCPWVGSYGRMLLIAPHVWLILLEWFVWWKLSCYADTVLLSVASRICLKQHAYIKVSSTIFCIMLEKS